MVYVPYEVVERLMIAKWESTLIDNPSASKPSPQEIRIEWFRMLEFYPQNNEAFNNFLNRFPFEDRKNILFRPYTGTRIHKRVRTQ